MTGPLSTPGRGRKRAAEAARALLVPGQRACPGCAAPLRARQRGACSNRCRAMLSRRRQVEARAAWLQAWAVRAYAALGIV